MWNYIKKNISEGESNSEATQESSNITEETQTLENPQPLNSSSSSATEATYEEPLLQPNEESEGSFETLDMNGVVCLVYIC